MFRYVQNGNKFHELRGDRLIAELERKLGIHLGSTVNLKINNADGTPRMCSRYQLYTVSARNDLTLVDSMFLQSTLPSLQYTSVLSGVDPFKQSSFLSTLSINSHVIFL